jgi:hypothetical protein
VTLTRLPLTRMEWASLAYTLRQRKWEALKTEGHNGLAALSAYRTGLMAWQKDLGTGSMAHEQASEARLEVEKEPYELGLESEA